MIGTISPDGTRAYGFVYGASSEGTLHTYDLTSPTGSGGFTEIGSGIPMPTSPGDFANVAISPDGSAIFVSGESNFIIQPVP
jgi:hypothetical protein